MVGEPATLPPWNQFFRVHLKNRSQHGAVPCGSFCFFFLAVTKRDRTELTPGKTGISWYMTDLRLTLWPLRCILLGFWIPLATTDCFCHLPEMTIAGTGD